MDSQDKWLIIGRFGRPHGIKGYVTIHSFTEPRENILDYKNWYAFLNNVWTSVAPLDLEVQVKNIIGKIKGYSDRELAAHLTGAEIAIDKEQLAKLTPGEYYWHQLIGMNVVNQEGVTFGMVTEILPTGSNDVLIVQGQKKHMIPYLPGRFITKVDEENKIITVDWDLDF